MKKYNVYIFKLLLFIPFSYHQHFLSFKLWTFSSKYIMYSILNTRRNYRKWCIFLNTFHIEFNHQNDSSQRECWISPRQFWRPQIHLKEVKVTRMKIKLRIMKVVWLNNVMLVNWPEKQLAYIKHSDLSNVQTFPKKLSTGKFT